MRPVLKPALRRLWRDPQTLQLGLHPDRAVVLTGIDDPASRVLRLLDGTRDRTRVLHDARAGGVHPGDTDRFLSMLEQAGALEDAGAMAAPLAALDRRDRERLAPDLYSLSLVHPPPGAAAWVLRRRQDATVHVLGGGRVGAPLAALLAAAGVRDVELVAVGEVRAEQTTPGGWVSGDVHRRAADATADLLQRSGSGGDRRVPGPARPRGVPRAPDLVVLVEPADDPAERERLQRAGTPHLLVGLRELTGFVGPMVLPGETPCLRCLDLQRSDRDPAWPLLAAQLGRPGPSACDVVLAAAVAAIGAGQALAHLDRAARAHPAEGSPVAEGTGPGSQLPASIGGVVELGLPEWSMHRREVGLHPSCGCWWAETG